jgi:hypothetical protein
MFSRKLTRFAAAGAAAVAVAVGGYAIGHSNSSNAASGVPTHPAGQFGPRFGYAPGQQTGQALGGRTGQAPEQVTGRVPAGWQPGSGTIITGAAADKAKAAAVAEYPGGTVNRVLQLSDGSYAVHRIGVPAPHHVFVSKDFKVTGAA